MTDGKLMGLFVTAIVVFGAVGGIIAIKVASRTDPVVPSKESEPAPTVDDAAATSDRQAQRSKPSVQTAGELFVTTKAGDVKKAAGQEIHLTSITPEFQRSVVSLLARANQSQAEHKRVWDEGYAKYLAGIDSDSPEYKARDEAFDREYGPRFDKTLGELRTALDTARNILLAGQLTVVTDGDGKFKIEIPPGSYVLWTAPRTMGEQSFSWCTIVEARHAPLNLILSEDSAFFYSDSPDSTEREPMHRLLREIASELAGR